MKKISVLCAVLAVVMSLSMFSICYAAEVTEDRNQVVSETVRLEDISALETGTYKVTVADGEEIGYFVIYDKNGEVQDYVIIMERDYGYIYFNADYIEGCTYSFNGVNVELISKDDLGVSSYHVFEIVEGKRDFDPIVDVVVDDTLVVEPESYGEDIDGIVYVQDLSEEDMIAMFS